MEGFSFACHFFVSRWILLKVSLRSCTGLMFWFLFLVFQCYRTVAYLLQSLEYDVILSNKPVRFDSITPFVEFLDDLCFVNRSEETIVETITGMLPYDSIEKPKIKTKTSSWQNFGDQLLGESIEKQRNGMRQKILAIYRTFHEFLKTGFVTIMSSFSLPFEWATLTCQQIKPNYFFCVLALRDVFSRVWEPFVILHYCQIMVKNR